MATYYHQPMLKRPVWIWSVPVYFYVGGLAGAALVLGAAAQVVNRRGLDGLVRRCRWMGAIGHGVGGFLLIIDLGRPERFLNMLRTLNLKSPLSVGSWVLAIGGAFSSASVILPRRTGDAAGLAAGLMGIPLAGYTGVLLAGTAIPIWQKERRSLPVVSVASGVAAAASLLEMMDLAPREEAAVRRFGILGKTAELAVMSSMNAPKGGLPNALFKAAAVLTAGSLALSLFSGGSRLKRAAGAVGTVGAIGLRFAIFYAGFTSEERLARTLHPGSQSPASHY